MLPQRRPAWLFFVSHKPKSLDFYPASSLFRTACNVRVEAIAGYGETRTASLSFFCRTAIPRNTDTQLLLRHESLPSLIIVEDTDFGDSALLLVKTFYHSKLFLQRSVALLG